MVARLSTGAREVMATLKKKSVESVSRRQLREKNVPNISVNTGSMRIVFHHGVRAGATTNVPYASERHEENLSLCVATRDLGNSPI
jgi:hypothetical protein